jgi:hypothetical protein
LPGLIFALTAGVVAEILIVGVFFRIIEDRLGTSVALTILALLFAILHLGAENATILSVYTTAVMAGVLLPAAYVLTRSLWFPIFLHFAWDLAEPAIYGGINPSASINKTLFLSKITGMTLLSGGKSGPQNSLESAIFCTITALILLFMAKQKNNLIKSISKNKNANHYEIQNG